MWIKLGNEIINLNQILRIKFTKTWKNGQDELAAEVECLIKGEIQVFTRYRGADAEKLQAAVTSTQSAVPVLVGEGMHTPLAPELAGGVNHPSTNTVHDLMLP
jgi:hypothetical protein